MEEANLADPSTLGYPCGVKLFLENLPASLASEREVLRRCIEAFAAAVPLKQVYLFGSHSRGNPTPDSDIDLCLVADGVESQVGAAQKLRRATRDIRPKPAFSLIPISPERLREKQARKDDFFQTVIGEGVLLAED